MNDDSLNVYSGRDAPELAPIYKLFEGLTGVRVNVTKIYHLNAPARVLAERDEPLADLFITNSQTSAEALREQGVLEPYEAKVAQLYEPWLRAPDFSWLSITAWPRSVLINRKMLPNADEWPQHIEDFTSERFRGNVCIATVNEETTLSHVSSIRAVKGDRYAFKLVDALVNNGIRLYAHNTDLRERFVPDGVAAAIGNSSNYNRSLLEGLPVGEAWLDQGPGELGTHIEAHVVAVLRGAKHPEAARDLIDFILDAETQTLLARMYGETPVNHLAIHGTVPPLAKIRRTEAPLSRINELRDSTRAYLVSKGWGPPRDYVPPD